MNKQAVEDLDKKVNDFREALEGKKLQPARDDRKEDEPMEWRPTIFVYFYFRDTFI